MGRAKNIGTIFAELAVKDKMSVGMKYARKQIQGMQRDAMAAGKTLASFGSAAAIGAAGFGISKAIKEAANMEVLETQFAALLKSEQAAIDLITKLRKMNVESPLGVEDFSKGAKQLLGVRMTADEAAIALDKLSNISMGNAENFESLVRAFAQTRSAGRLMGQEVLQFVNAGFNPLAEISVKTGESMAALKKRMEDGKISFDEVERAITSATAAGGLFNGMNAKMAATMEGKMQKLKDNFNQFFIALGKPINETLKPELDKLNNYDFSTLGKNLGESIASAFEGISDGTMWEIWSLKGFAAIADLGNNMSNSIMAAVEAGLQSAFGKSGKSFGDYLMENLDSVAGAETEFGKTLRKDAATLEAELERRRKKKLPIPFVGPPAPAMDSSKPITVEVAKTAATEKAFDWQAGKMEVDEYQRRGLSMSSDGGAAQAKRSIDYLAKIADILGKAKLENRALVWGQ